MSVIKWVSLELGVINVMSHPCSWKKVDAVEIQSANCV